MHRFLLFLVGSLIVAFLGRNCRFGFWGNFFASMLLSPVVGLLLVLSGSPTAAPTGGEMPQSDTETKAP